MSYKNFKNNRRKDEYEKKIIDIARTARVVAGGRRFSFRVSAVAGNKKGEVGVGLGKAPDTSLAIEKAFKNAKKNMIKVNLTDKFSIPHAVEAKFASAKVIMMPSFGHGLVAGSSVRIVLEMAGIKRVNAKILSRSKNKLNNARAAILALTKLK
ncbi:MAG TPA: 30S ribosomal protein S5 [bacterium]|nr:30S ribosomal protein S5 [bacterium]